MVWTRGPLYKGILITTGIFSSNAEKFAQNKNLELIDGTNLFRLLYEHKLIDYEESIHFSHFSQFECFDNRKYTFFKQLMDQGDMTEAMGRAFLFSFMFNYLIDDEHNISRYEMIHAGFAAEFLSNYDWFRNKYYKRGKEKLEKIKHYNRTYKGIALLYNFDLFEYVKDRYDSLKEKYTRGSMYWFKFSKDPDNDSHWKSLFPSDWEHEYEYEETYERFIDKKNYVMENLFDSNHVVYGGTSKFYELINLLSIFFYFNITRGIELVNDILFGDNEELQYLVTSTSAYINAKKKIVITYYADYKAISAGNYYEMDITPYFDEFKFEERAKINDEIKKIEMLLDSL